MKIHEAPYLIIDVETTGLDYQTDQVVDIACVELHAGTIRPLFESLVNPGREIPTEASAVHHITDEDVRSAPLWGEVVLHVSNLIRGRVRVAHNANFDKMFLPEEYNPWLCTYRLSKHVWPDLPRHTNQFLRYHHKLDIPRDIPVHRALGDAIVTAHILHRLLDDFSPEMQVQDLVNYCWSPCLVSKMPFGKHFGKPLEEVPPDYIEWALKNIKDMDADLRYTLERRQVQ